MARAISNRRWSAVGEIAREVHARAPEADVLEELSGSLAGLGFLAAVLGAVEDDLSAMDEVRQ